MLQYHGCWDPSFYDLFFEPIPEEVLSLVDEVQPSTSSTSELLCNTTKLDCMIVCLIQMQFYCKMHWCKSVQACLAIGQESICSRFQMSQIPNVGSLLNHLAQPKVMITASHVFQKINTNSNTTWSVRVFNEWIKARNSGASHANICPRDLLIHSHPISVLDYCLAAFVLEQEDKMEIIILVIIFLQVSFVF